MIEADEQKIVSSAQRPEMPALTVLKLALPTPLRRTFEYLPPVGAPLDETTLVKGTRVKVPFGHQELVGILLSVASESSIDADKLKPAIEVLDKEALITPEVLELCQWAATYYHYSLGEVIHIALPNRLRKAISHSNEEEKGEIVWQHTTEGKGLPETALKRSPKQQLVHQTLLELQQVSQQQFKELGVSTAVLKAIAAKGLIESTILNVTEQVIPPQPSQSADTQILKESPRTLNEEQENALALIRYHQFQCNLLEGTTGSGKTEVYLHAIARALQAGKQALVLVPEIGLTPQTFARFEARFAVPIAQLHSAIAEKQRLSNWLAAASGKARIIIGTRLSVFTPFKELGIIIVDEEHDLSFKQQDGLHYSARDLAIIRAKNNNIPLILGSATPSLESLNNARSGRYHHLRLLRRAGGAKPPVFNVVDMRKQSTDSGLSAATIEAIKNTIQAKQQVLVFINRRGFAPVYLCQDCGWSSTCLRCDAKMTLHSQPYHLRCHHCDAQRPIPRQCPECLSTRLVGSGQGTEKTEEALNHLFSDTPIFRVDQDSMRNKGAMKKLYDDIEKSDSCILVGTQMLAKGHHFPRVTLVVIVDADTGLLSGDFRGAEKMGQQVTQVAGRSGRADLPGQVLLQSYRPDHPLLQSLIHDGYSDFATQILEERQAANLPPYTHMVLVKAESKRPDNAIDFLKLTSKLARQICPPSPERQFLGPIPSFIEKRQDRFRFQLQIKFHQRKHLQALLQHLLPQIENHALSRRTRWSIDVDPQDFS